MENNEMTVQNGQGLPNVPVMSNGVAAQLDKINQGTVAIEASRAIAEAQGKLVIAKRFPRDESGPSFFRGGQRDGCRVPPLTV